MDIQQIKLKSMETFCYMIGDRSTNTCALIDPAFETDRILNIARDKGYTVTHVINTHCHSDHSAGNAAIIAETGAQLLIHRLDAKFLGQLRNSAFSRMLGGKGSPEPDRLLDDNDIINVGNIDLKVIHTPGHTPGGICLYTGGNIFTGDTLFVEAVGRTDLPGGSTKTLLASIHKKVYTLANETVVWPGHDYGPFPQSTIAHEKANNLFTIE